MPPKYKLSPAFIAMMLDNNRKDVPSTPTPSGDAVRTTASPSSPAPPEPHFTPLEVILGERPAASSAPVSAKPAQAQLARAPLGPERSAARQGVPEAVGQLSKPSSDWRSFSNGQGGAGRQPNIPAGIGLVPDQPYKIPSLLPKPPSFMAPALGTQRTNAVAVGLKAANWGRSEVDGWNYTVLARHPEARGVVRGDIGHGVGALKCNLFVYDALAAAGAAPNRIGGRVPSAAEWGDPGFSGIRDYPPVVTLTIPKGGLDKGMISSLHVGDIISDREHVGLVSFREGNPRTISAASMKAHPPIGGVVENDWGFRPGQTVTIRRYRPFGAIY